MHSSQTLIEKLSSRILINSDKHNAVYELLFHSSLIPIPTIIEIIASIQCYWGFLNLMIKYEPKAILHPAATVWEKFGLLPLHKHVLSCSQRVETGQDSVAGELHIIHWNKQKHSSSTHLFFINNKHKKWKKTGGEGQIKRQYLLFIMVGLYKQAEAFLIICISIYFVKVGKITLNIQ